MNIYTEENFNDFAILGKKSFSLGKILESSASKEEIKNVDDEDKQDN